MVYPGCTTLPYYTLLYTTLATLPYVHQPASLASVPCTLLVCTGPGLPDSSSEPSTAPSPGLLDGIIYLVLERAWTSYLLPRGGFKRNPGPGKPGRSRKPDSVSQVCSLP